MSMEFEGELVLEMATDEDWDYIMPGFVEGTFMAMGPGEREELGPATLRERCAMQAEWVRSPDGFFNQAFLARTADGEMVGHVWIARVLNQFTGRSEALVLNLFVEEDFRGRGAAKRLMAVAEEWAKGQDLERIGLSVAVDNEPAVRLYEEMGYTPENQRMTRRL
ncbi:MAG: GNAT family N-acetyltransferase [Thermoplasmata archaeon]|nr:MAG: GNAT family N-acetyltransferase [Thermoplasmata archaeon]